MISKDLTKITGLCSAVAATCIELKFALSSTPAADLCQKRLAYQSAVRLFETTATLDHRSLYNRLFNIRVAGASKPQTAFDGGAAARAAETYNALLKSDVKVGDRRNMDPSPALTAVAAYQDRIDRGPVGASAAAMAQLVKAGWLPSPLPPIAWSMPVISQRKAHDLKPVLVGLRRIHDVLDEALQMVRQVLSFVGAALEATSTYREGSAVRLLIPLLVLEPVVSQGLILERKLMSDVAFQNGTKLLDGLGVCIELTKRQSHRGWAAAGKGLLPNFDGFEVHWFTGDRGNEQQSLSLRSAQANQDSDLAELDQAVADLDRLLQP